MLKLFLSLLFIFLLQSCMTRHKVNKIVGVYYSSRNLHLEPPNRDNLIINTDSIAPVKGYCQSHYERSYMIPLLIYYYSQEIIKCQINPVIFANTVAMEISSSQKKKENVELIDGKQLEITFKSVPSNFSHKFKGHVVVTPLFVITLSKNEVYMSQSNYRFDYTLKDKNTLALLKQGSVTKSIPFNYVKIVRGEGRKKIIKAFIKQLDYEMADAGAEMTRTLMKQLKNETYEITYGQHGPF